jgi:hypothetical protein
MKSTELKEKFTMVRGSLKASGKEWESMFAGLNKKKGRVEKKIEKTCKDIEKMFNLAIEGLKRRQGLAIATFKKKAENLMGTFFTQFHQFEESLRGLRKQLDDVKELKGIFKGEDNLCILEKASEMKMEEELFNSNDEFEKKMEEFRAAFQEIKGKDAYIFTLTNKFNEDELAEFIEKQYVINIEKKPETPMPASSEMEKPKEDSSIAIIKEEKKDEEDKEAEVLTKKTDLIFHRFDFGKKPMWTYQNKEFKPSEFSIEKAIAGEEEKKGKEIPDPSDDASPKTTTDMCTTQAPVSKVIIGYQRGETGTKVLYKFDTGKKKFEKKCELPGVYKKISVIEESNSKCLVIGGEPVGVVEEGKQYPILFTLNQETNVLSVFPRDKLPKIKGYTMCLLKKRYLYLLPLSLHHLKIYRTGLDNPTTIVPPPEI